MFHTASKLFWYLAEPLTLVFLLVVLAGLFVFTRFRRLTQFVAVFAALAFFAIGFTTLGQVMVASLEAQYARPAEPDRIDGIIVLGGAIEASDRYREDGYELFDAADRFVEAARLARLHPEARILVSGGVGALGGTGVGDAVASISFFGDFGIGPDRLILDSQSRNTFENAINTATLIDPAHGDVWLLVTSAFHMPRAMDVFRAADVRVIPWPTDLHAPAQPALRLDFANPLPNAASVSMAVHEYLGTLAYRMTGRI
jgi:uncharacterized SAM-binding protein YcdF (DUF218 family)